MVTPSTLGSISMGSTLAGGILSTLGNIYQGMAGSNMYKYKAQIAQYNAMIAAQNSDYALQKGEIEAQGYGLKARQQMGKIVTALSASGLDVNSGSAAMVKESQHQVAMMDLDQLRSNAAKTAYDYRVQSTAFQNEAMLNNMAAEDSSRAGFLGGLSSLIGMSGSVADKWLRGNQLGLYGR